MASLTVADAGRELHAITVFPTAFAKAYMHVQTQEMYINLNLKKLKDGTSNNGGCSKCLMN
jgi:hypothetical protein